MHGELLHECLEQIVKSHQFLAHQEIVWTNSDDSLSHSVLP
jgi:hypothetical protein